MKSRLGYTSILTAFALCGLLLISGCEAPALGVTQAGQAAANGPTRVAQRAYANVRIKQIGRSTFESEEFARAAALKALGALTNAGVPEADLIAVEVEGKGGMGIFMGGALPQYYDVWVKVAGCPSRVHFKAQASGTIYEMNDRANCAAKAKAAGAPAY